MAKKPKANEALEINEENFIKMTNGTYPEEANETSEATVPEEIENDDIFAHLNEVDPSFDPFSDEREVEPLTPLSNGHVVEEVLTHNKEGRTKIQNDRVVKINQKEAMEEFNERAENAEARDPDLFDPTKHRSPPAFATHHKTDRTITQRANYRTLEGIDTTAPITSNPSNTAGRIQYGVVDLETVIPEDKIVFEGEVDDPKSEHFTVCVNSGCPRREGCARYRLHKDRNNKILRRPDECQDDGFYMTTAEAREKGFQAFTPFGALESGATPSGIDDMNE